MSYLRRHRPWKMPLRLIREQIVKLKVFFYSGIIRWHLHYAVITHPRLSAIFF